MLMGVFRSHSQKWRSQSELSVSIVVAACNEENVIEGRILDILNSTYPKNLLEIIVVSDGSTDRTDELVEKLGADYETVKLIRIPAQSGRANAHNTAVPGCQGDILVFTDADTSFDKDFISRIVAPFSDEQVGFASGTLIYQNRGESEVTESVGFYWRYELALRTLESKLGILAFGSGACLAVRRDLFQPIPPSGDVDFITPLDVVLQSYKCIHVKDALAYDRLPDSDAKEFKARVRMTAKNFHGTILRWGFSNLFLHPVYSLVIFFHKIARWLTPFFFIGILISNLFLLDQGAIYRIAFTGQCLFYFLGLAGLLGIRLLFSGQIYSFLLANIGFLFGILKAVTGRVPKSYTPVNKDG